MTTLASTKQESALLIRNLSADREYLHTELEIENGARVWAITEAGSTTILLPEDY